MKPIDFIADAPLTSIVLIVAWQWLPFATLILLTAIQVVLGRRARKERRDGQHAAAGHAISCYRIWRGRAVVI
ncbi:MAG: hypothetical protein R3D05_14720 [Dongiaceae bacterium]